MIWLPARRSSIRLLLSLLAGIASLRASELPRHVEDLLRGQIGFTASQLQRVHRGTVLAKVLPETAREEVAVAGLIYARVPSDFVLREIEDMENFKKRAGGPANSKVPPTASRTGHPAIVNAIGGSCVSLDMPSGQLRCQAFEQHDEKACASAGSNRLQYEQPVSNSVLPVLHGLPDSRKRCTDYLPGQAAARELSVRHQQYCPSAFVAWKLFAALRRSLENHISIENAPPDLDGFYYWSKEKFALKPVVSLTQTSAWHTTDQQSPMALILSRQLYASHYSQGSIGLTIVFQDALAPARECGSPTSTVPEWMHLADGLGELNVRW